MILVATTRISFWVYHWKISNTSSSPNVIPLLKKTTKLSPLLAWTYLITFLILAMDRGTYPLKAVLSVG